MVGAKIRLMTSNVLMGRADPVAYDRLLAELNPDVVVIQELGHNLVPIIEKRFPNHSLHPADEFIGRGIATKLDVEFGEIEMPLRTGTSAKLMVDGEVWDLAGTHLANAIDWPWWKSVGIRTGQLDALEKWLGESRDGPVVVAGDFNASPSWPAYRRVAGMLDDVVSGWGNENSANLGRTWGWRPGWPAMLRIDHVFARGIRACHVEVHKIDGSDHRAVVVDLNRDENRVE